MKKNKITMALLVSVLGIAVPVAAARPDTHNVTLTTPSGVVGNVIPLGTTFDIASWQVVEGYAIVRYKTGENHKPNHGKGSGGGDTAGPACYTYLAKDAKWKTVEPWLMNPSNVEGLDGNTIFALTSNGIAKWEDATDGTAGNGVGSDVLGFGTLTNSILVADTTSTDGLNEVYFGDVSSNGAIAVTIVWGVFGGPPFARQLVEWDMILDQADFDWSTTGDVTKMDFDNIITHELGHAFGLGDLYTAECSEETMYGYGTEGETKKQTLNSGDIEGINKLY